jgi:pimeloyl-ACP methyl ester carboxylesterase
VATADGPASPRGILLLLAGGPGQPGVPLASRLAARLADVLDEYRLVLLDQRGTGEGALVCPALQRQLGYSDLRPPTTPAVRACASELGSDRRFYRTADTVADLELLRRALGADRWAVDGVSYGTFVAARYALAHPRRVSHLVLDSVVPHTGFDLRALDSMRATARVLRSACRAAACAGDPAADLAAVVRRGGRGPALLDALVLLSIVDPSFVDVFDVPRALREARAGRTAALDAMLETVARWARARPEELSQGLHATTLCADLPGPWGDSATPLAGRRTALERSLGRLPARAVWPFDRATASANGLVATCLAWPPTRPGPALGPRPRLAVPTLLLAGGRDLSTPLAWARRAAALAPGSRLVVVAAAGHSLQTRAGSGAVPAIEEFLRR